MSAPRIPDDAPTGTFLEESQLSSALLQPVPRAELSEAARSGLWALRIAAVLLSAVVVYTFVAQIV